ASIGMRAFAAVFQDCSRLGVNANFIGYTLAKNVKRIAQARTAFFSYAFAAYSIFPFTPLVGTGLSNGCRTARGNCGIDAADPCQPIQSLPRSFPDFPLSPPAIRAGAIPCH